MAHVRDLIHRSLDADLSAVEAQELGLHLSTCDECRGTATLLRRNDQLLAHQEPLPAVPARRTPQPRPFRFVLPSLVAAATLGLALVAGNALAAWRTGNGIASSAGNGPVVVSRVGVCGQAQEQASLRARTIQRFQVRRLPLADVLGTKDARSLIARTAADSFDEATARITMVCVVEVVGEIDAPPSVPAPGSPAQWMISATIAGSGAALGGIAGTGPAPAWFDVLPDTRRDLVPGTLVAFVDPQTVRVQLESAKMSEEFGSPALFAANRFTDIRPPNATLASTGAKPGDRVFVFFERDGRDAAGAYPLSVFDFAPAAGAPSAVPSPRGTWQGLPLGALPVCPLGQTPVLDVSNNPPPGDQPGTGAPTAEAAFRRTYPAITNYLMFPFGSDQPTKDPGVLGQGPVWVVAGPDTFVVMYIGPVGQNSWFAHPATFQGCRTPSAAPARSSPPSAKPSPTSP